MLPKLITALTGLLLFGAVVEAEPPRYILMGIDEKLLVTTGSTVPGEDRRRVTIGEAADILVHAPDLGGGVIVVIVSESDAVDIRELKPLLDAFEKNPALKLRYIRLGKNTKDFDASWRPSGI